MKTLNFELEFINLLRIYNKKATSLTVRNEVGNKIYFYYLILNEYFYSIHL